MEGSQKEEPWMQIRRMASASTRGVKSPPQVHSYEAPSPSPPIIPLKDDSARFVASPDNERLMWNAPQPQPTHLKQEQTPTSRFSGISIPLLFVLSTYSTVLSGIWFLLAVIKPHYGTFIGSNGANISPGTASTVVAGVAKTIELSFITVFLACLGQFFTKQAFNKMSPGISLADIQLKTMIVQPGSLLTQWRSYGLVWKSMLGLLSLLACFSGTLYTTASDALVTPVMSIHPPVVMSLLGPVKASIANIFFIDSSCPSPITLDEDPASNYATCEALSGSGFAYKNYMGFITAWNQSSRTGDGVSIQDRPIPTAMLNDNVTVHGEWIEPINVFSQDDRIVSNVSMVMPHAGIVAASALAENRLLQVEGTSNVAELDVNARTVVPTLNVLCASASAEDLVPITYSNFTNPDNKTVNATYGSWPTTFNSTGWYNKTVFDDIFGFTPDRPPPLFYNMPAVYNTNLNSSGNRPDALYILLNSNVTEDHVSLEQPYTLCGLSFTLRTGCSSSLQSLISGSVLASDCSANNDMAYVPTAANNATSWDRNREWVSVASGLTISISLNGGMTDNDASTARLLTQLAPINDTLNPWRPSLAETLAVLAANTLLDSTIDAPFDGAGPFDGTVTPDAILPTPSLQPFTASVQMSDYASGGSASWQNVFVIILIPLFLLNCLCFVYLAWISVPQHWLPRWGYHNPNQPGAYQNPHPFLHSGVQRDFTDMQNLFVLALGTAEPREGSLMREKTTKWSHSPVEGRDSSPAASTRPRSWFFGRGSTDHKLPSERDERHKLLGTKWHIQEKRPRHSNSTGLGLGLDSSAEGTPNLGARGSNMGYGTVGNTNGYHIVVDGEQQQHHFRRRPAQGDSGRARGRFEKYLSPQISSKGGSPGESGNPLDAYSPPQDGVTRNLSGSQDDVEMKDIRRSRHISGPMDVKSSIGILPGMKSMHQTRPSEGSIRSMGSTSEVGGGFTKPYNPYQTSARPSSNSPYGSYQPPPPPLSPYNPEPLSHQQHRETGDISSFSTPHARANSFASSERSEEEISRGSQSIHVPTLAPQLPTPRLPSRNSSDYGLHGTSGTGAAELGPGTPGIGRDF